MFFFLVYVPHGFPVGCSKLFYSWQVLPPNWITENCCGACYNISVKQPYFFTCVLLVACVLHAQFKSYFSCNSFSPSPHSH